MFSSKAEETVKVYFEEVENGYNIYADNQEFCSVSLKVDFKNTNLEVAGGNHNIYLVEPLSEKQLLTKLTVSKKGRAYRLSFQSMTTLGDRKKETYDKDYVYNLPFTNSNSFEVYQGNNGNFSHRNTNALDFTMPVGTELAAIREGTVIKVVQKNNKHSAKKECQKYNNYIIVQHPDGSFAKYTHIKKKGSIVKP